MNARVETVVWFNILACLESVHYREPWAPLVRREFLN